MPGFDLPWRKSADDPICPVGQNQLPYPSSPEEQGRQRQANASESVMAQAKPHAFMYGFDDNFEPPGTDFCFFFPEA